MTNTPIPESEGKRIETLNAYEILDTTPESQFDDLTKLAAYICNAPTALISLVDNDRQWFKSRIGLDVSETSRDVAFCAHTILDSEVMVVNDATLDDRFKDNPLVTGDLHLRFYAGAPLQAPNGENLGSLCILDYESREITEEQKDALNMLSRQVIAQMELRKKLFQTEQQLKEESESRIKSEVEKHVAIEAAKAKSDFLAVMSHEIRTPLNAVLGFSELLTQEITDDKHLSFLQTINASGKNLLNLINDILDFSKIEAGRIQLHLEPVNVVYLMDELERLFSVNIQKKGLSWDSSIQSNIPSSLVLDEGRLTQILVNIIGNALKFTEKGGISINVTTEVNTNDTSKMSLIFEITDTGVGIKQEALQRIFESFQQQDSGVSKKFGGTGLGLAITRRLLELMDGEVKVESTYGRGSTFSITLRNVAVSSVQAQHPNDQVFDVGGLEFNHETVLVVDDIKSNRDLVRQWLERVNLTIVEAVNGKDAVAVAKERKPDLIFMDIRMPVMDGYESTKLIKENPELSHIPVVALTASVTMEEQDRILDYGFSHFLGKPVFSNQLFQTILKYIKPLSAIETVVTTSAKTVLSIDRVPSELKSRLDGELKDRCKEVRELMVMEDVEEFVELISELAKKGDVHSLTDWCTSISKKIDEFNIDGIERFLIEFDSVIEKIEVEK